MRSSTKVACSSAAAVRCTATANARNGETYAAGPLSSGPKTAASNAGDSNAATRPLLAAEPVLPADEAVLPGDETVLPADKGVLPADETDSTSWRSTSLSCWR